MRFGNLEYLWLLPVPAALAIFYVIIFKRKSAAMARFAAPALMRLLVSGVSKRKQIARKVMMVMAVSLMILALIEPMWGYQHVQAQRQGVDIVVAIDTSRSMLATDVSPSRIERAKLKVIDLLRILDGDRIALVAFAGEAYIKCPLTEDYETAEMLLRQIDVGVIPQGSTAIGRAIRRGIMAFHTKERKHKAMIILTDGEDHGSDPIPSAQEAGKEGIVIFTVGIGTPAGEYIMIEEKGKRIRLKDKDGKDVKSRLDEALLNAIPAAANAERDKLPERVRGDEEIQGHYIPAYDPNWSLEDVYARMIGSMEKRRFEPRWVKKYHNRYQLPLLLAAILLTVEGVMGEGKREAGRKRRKRWNEPD